MEVSELSQMTGGLEGTSGSPSPTAIAPRALALAICVAIAFYAAAGLSEAMLIRALRPSEMELDWISDAVLSSALGIAVYLWLHLRATRVALTERERDRVIIEAQLSMAEAMQRRLLPSIPHPADGFEWAAVLTPAGKIGGDFFDFFEPAPGIRVTFIADVSGKGISAAMALTLLRFTFRQVARDTQGPAELACRMSAALYDEWRGTPYVTGVVARIDVAAHTLTYTNAGHPPGVLVRDAAARGLAEGGPPLGLFPDAHYVEEQLDLNGGDVCVLLTDGITEAFDEAVQPWRSMVLDAVQQGHRSARAVCNAIMARARDGHGPAGVDWTDDRTVIVMSVKDERGLERGVA